MAKEKTYLNILDQMLDSGMESAEMDDSRKRGDDLSDLTQDLAEDGLFTSHVAASAEASRTIIAKKLSDDNILNDVEISENKAKSNKDGLANAVEDTAVLAAIEKLLKRGHSPKKILAALQAKRAEINLNDRTFSMSADYLNRRSNDLGMGYIQPNTFMPKTPLTYESKKPDLKHASAHIAVEGEDILGLAETKFGGDARVQKRAIEISTAEPTEARSGNIPLMARVPDNQPASVRTARDAAKTASAYHRGADEFDSGTIAEMHVAGKSFEQIWREACANVGLHLAAKSFNEYVNRAKRDGKKFASADVDFLREKLGHKGVEVAPEKSGPLSRIAYDGSRQGNRTQDGNELLNEFELTASRKPFDIETNSDASFDVEAGKPEINF